MHVRRTSTILALALSSALTIAAAGPSPTGMTTNRVADGLTATDLANELLGAGVSLVSASLTGADSAAGTFAGSTAVGFPDGVILSSGDVDTVLGPNVDTGMTTAHGTPGDPDLAALTGQSSFDAVSLEIVLVPDANTITFQYVFGSEEYLEYVNSGVNDVFAFFVNGTNCATFNDENDMEQIVSIDTINSTTNSSLYRDNGDDSLDIEFDGLTVIMECNADVNPGEENTLRLALSDSGDEVLDSAVFLQGGSVTSANTVLSYTGDLEGQYSDPATLSATLEMADSTPVAGELIEFAVGSQTASATTDADGVATTTLLLDQAAGPVVVMATFAGNGDDLTASADEDDFEVLHEDCILEPDVADALLTGTVPIRAQMSESDDYVGDLSGHAVDFTIAAEDVEASLGSDKTNGNGVASVDFDLAVGEYSMDAAFAGDEYYNACNAEQGTLNVVEPEPEDDILDLGDTGFGTDAALPIAVMMILLGAVTIHVSRRYA